MDKELYIAVDFDGTVVTHVYPGLGVDIGAAPVLKALIEKGHKILLNTMRSQKDLYDAVNWFTANDIKLFGANRNPTQDDWTSSPKVYAHLYIDDAALGAPLKFDTSLSKRPFIDWELVEKMLKEKGIL